MMRRMTIALAGFLFLSYTGWTQPTSALENYRRLQFPLKDETFAKGWQERVAPPVRPCIGTMNPLRACHPYGVLQAARTG